MMFKLYLTLKIAKKSLTTLPLSSLDLSIMSGWLQLLAVTAVCDHQIFSSGRADLKFEVSYSLSQGWLALIHTPSETTLDFPTHLILL